MGRGSNLIVTVPADGRGLFTKYDSASLTKELTDNNEETIETFTNPSLQSIEITLKSTEKINRIVAKENLIKDKMRSVHNKVIQ